MARQPIYLQVLVMFVLSMLVPLAGADEAQAVAQRKLSDIEIPKQWFWQADGNALGKADNWEQALEQANDNRNNPDGTRGLMLDFYQRVLDANPPADEEARVRLEMGGAMTVYFAGPEPAQAIPWYAQIIAKHKAQSHHRSVMVARIHLANCLAREYGRAYSDVIDTLYREVLAVPADEIVFDPSTDARLSVAAIKVAQSPSLEGNALRFQGNAEHWQRIADRMNAEHRSRLLGERKEMVDSLRGGAARAWVWDMQSMEPRRDMRPQIETMRKEFAGDEAVVQEIDKALEGMK